MRYAGARPRPAGNAEAYAWFFMRVSGVVLLFMAVFHLLWMHLVVRVDNIDFQLIAGRWSNPAWRLYDLLLLVFALGHGANGARTVIDDYLPRGLANVATKWALYALILTLAVMGAHIILTFQVPPEVSP